MHVPVPKMEDLATFIQSMSEKYGLLDPAGNKIGTAATGRLQRKNSQTTGELLLHHDVDQKLDDGSLGVGPTWECLSAFLNSHDGEGDKHIRNGKINSPTSRKRMVQTVKTQEELSQENGEEDESQEVLFKPGSVSSDRDTSPGTVSVSKTSDLIHNASFLDELQNPSLSSDDLQSTGMAKGHTSTPDPTEKETDHCTGQSSLSLQEFLMNGEGMADLELRKDQIGLSGSANLPQKEDARWQTSELWFREYCTSRRSKKSYSERSVKSVRSDTKLFAATKAEGSCFDRELDLAHEIVCSSGSSSSPATELDGQVEDCHSAAASECGDSSIRSRCVSPEGFAAALQSVERGRERAALVNARVEKMLEESGTAHHAGGRDRVLRESDGALSNPITRISHKKSGADTVRGSEMGSAVLNEGTNGSSSLAVKQRVADIDEASKMLLAQLDKSRSPRSPSKQCSSSRRWSPSTHSSPARSLASQINVSLDGAGHDISEDDNDVTSPTRQRDAMNDDVGNVSSPQSSLGRNGFRDSRILHDHDLLQKRASPRGIVQQQHEYKSRPGSPTSYEADYDSRPNEPRRRQQDLESRPGSTRHQYAGPDPIRRDPTQYGHDTRRASPRHHEEDDHYPMVKASSRHQQDRYHDATRVSSRDLTHSDQRRRGSFGNQQFHDNHDQSRASTRYQLQSHSSQKGAASRDQQVDRDQRCDSPRPQQGADCHDPRSASSGDQQQSSRYQHEVDYEPRRATIPRDIKEGCGGSSGTVYSRENCNSHEGDERVEDCESSHGVANHENCTEDEIPCPRYSQNCNMDYGNTAKSWDKVWDAEEDEPVERTNESRPSERYLNWERINDLLCQNGFSKILSLSPDADFEEEVHLVVADVINNYQRREKLVQALLEENEEFRQTEERNNIHMQQLEGERDELRQKLSACEQRAEIASEAADRNHVVMRRECQKLESANANLMQRCRNSQLEHACRAKERSLQKLQDKVRVSMVKEERHRSNDKEMYEKLKHKVASAHRTNGEPLEPNFLQRDLKPAQIVGIYERQRVVMETEIATLRTENAQLCRDLCEKENLILSKVLGSEETKKTVDILTQKKQSQMKEKDEEIWILEEKLKARPTIEELKGSSCAASFQQEPHGQRSNGHGRERGCQEKILNQICQLLELDEPCFIVETLESLLLLVMAVPRMEQFVGDVCDIVFCDGQNWSVPSNCKDNEVARTPDAVPGILQAWLQKLDDSSELLTFKDSIVQMLWERDESMRPSDSGPVMSSRVALGCVKNLIDVEKDYLLSKESYREADAVVKAEPQNLLHRVLAHFQMLFEIPKLEGVMAVMNSVYIQCSEYHNFARALCSMLGLDKDAGPNTIISSVNSLLSSSRVM